MAYLKISNFSGIVPRTGPTQIEANQAQTANNVKLQSKEIRSWRKAVSVYTPTTTGVQTIYKLEGTGGAYKWLTWNSDVDVVPGPIADSTDYRIYYSENGVPKKTNWALATTSGAGSDPYPNSWLNMGVPNPTGAPTLVKTGGSGTVHEDRAYIYTYVSTFGSVKEESGPSPATVVSVVEPDATVTVSGFATAPTTNYNITHRRIYRSVAGTSSTTYAFVAEISIATTSYADTLLATQLGEALPSLYYLPPPSGLKGIVAMPNGMLAGFVNNEVWFCEPYLPHAWPSQYMMSVEHPIVGLGVYDNNLVVLTTKHPYIMTGTTPSAMSEQKLPLQQPCASKRSIASDQYGVLYASPNGLVSIGSGTQDLISTPLYTRDEWQTLIPTSMIGVIYNNLYMLFHSTSTVVKCKVIARGEIPPLSSLDFDATAVFIERSTGYIYGVSSADNKIYQLDADTVNNISYIWRSKKFVLPSPLNFAALKLQADYGYIGQATEYNAIVAAIIASNAALWAALAGKSLGNDLNDPILNTYALNASVLQDIPTLGDVRNVQVIVYADGVQVFATSLTSQEPVRMPPATKSYVWEVEFQGTVPVREFEMATSIGELRTV